MIRRWYPLAAESVPDYLNATGVCATPTLTRVWRIGGRNHTYAVSADFDGRPSFFLKQFGPEDFDDLSFESERFWSSSNAVPGPGICHADDQWRVLVSPTAGQSLLGLLRTDGEPAQSVAGPLLQALRLTHGQRSDVEATPPPILTWLTAHAKHRSPRGLAGAQLRLLAAVATDPAIQLASARASDLWQLTPNSLIHNDLKLSHVTVAWPSGRSGAPEVKLVDWEFARNGPASWDYAGLLQSLLTEVALNEVSWSATVADIAGALLAQASAELETFVDLVALRLLQTAIELETGAPEITHASAQICQLASSLARSPDKLEALLAPA